MSNELSENHIIPGELLFYTSPDGKVKMELRVEGETIWMSQQMMAELFQMGLHEERMWERIT